MYHLLSTLDSSGGSCSSLPLVKQTRKLPLGEQKLFVSLTLNRWSGATSEHELDKLIHLYKSFHGVGVTVAAGLWRGHIPFFLDIFTHNLSSWKTGSPSRSSITACHTHSSLVPTATRAPQRGTSHSPGERLLEETEDVPTGAWGTPRHRRL